MKKVLCLFFAVLNLKAEEIYASFDVYALHQSKLAFESNGIVKEIKVEPSSVVKKGDILIILENSSELIGLQNAQNRLALAEIAFKNAQSKMDKFKEVQSMIDTQSFEDMEASFKRAGLELESAKINVKYYENLLDKKNLKAPFDGIIAAKFVELGQGVAAISQAVLEIYSYPEVKLVISFDEKYKDRVKVGQNYRFKLKGQDKEQNAKISLIYPSIDIKTRKIFAEVKSSHLTPGLFGEGVIIAE
ncbi:efflux RND transporter periplasmic adaptor subunit [Campylobacter sp. MIT 97-5078]|uniref:efflux RND transporter periplasmic adaptor subunit n=1 Tax=Campylobacter sp. MIT 97-5078 TaxID=1548153 RepID=UPI0005141DF7|nr:efflux RND transporter periplasmic adaptor subunit [Campylobacter sp. MIT 97-5078]KGI56235.1 hemolysin D [Campylobacter sp. MIT 97-5078]TQR27245.1 efflux RND transporter periplasmic adaptor subunit [Campylobacter sp. MIT 97-5078]